MLIRPGLVFHTPDICGRKSELKIAWAALVIVWSRRLYNTEWDWQGGKFGTHASKKSKKYYFYTSPPVACKTSLKKKQILKKKSFGEMFGNWWLKWLGRRNEGSNKCFCWGEISIKYYSCQLKWLGRVWGAPQWENYSCNWTPNSDDKFNNRWRVGVPPTLS